MLIRKARRMLAGLCVALMLTQSVGESALTVVAAERGAEATVEEGFLEEEDVAAGAVVSDGDVEEAATDIDGSPVTADLYSARAVTSQDGADWGNGVLVKADGSITVTRNKIVEVVGRIDSDGVVTIDKNFNMIYAGLFCAQERDNRTAI